MVRRTSEICLFDPLDFDIMDSKVGIWDKDTINSGKTHRGMSNNTILYKNKPNRENLLNVFKRIYQSAEPGLCNFSALQARRPWAEGANPCFEIILSNKGVCNLSEINLVAFVKNGDLVINELIEAVRLATRVGLRQTNITMSLPEWDKIQKRDRLTGVSITGIMDAQELLNDTWGYEDFEDLLRLLNFQANEEALDYAKEMRIPAPLLVTAIKPSGSISQLPTVSSGIHRSYAPHYIRRVRISSSDPLAKVMLDLGFPVYPEAGQGPSVAEFEELSKREQINALEKANTWVIEFPVKTCAKTAASAESAISQFQRYLMMQRSWTDHNTSITIYFGEDEIESLVDEILKEWDNYIAVSFLPKDNAIYPLMPYEEITEDEYMARENILKDVSTEMIEELLTEYEREDMMSELLDSDCSTGACPTR